MRILTAQARKLTYLTDIGNVRAVVEHVNDSCRDERISKFTSPVLFENSRRTQWRFHWHKVFPHGKRNNHGETDTEQDHDTGAGGGYEVCVDHTCKDKYSTGSKQNRSNIVQNLKCSVPGDSTRMFRWEIEPVQNPSVQACSNSRSIE